MTLARRDRIVAVPLLGERSGGIGQVSSLLWRAVSETWPAESTVVELVRHRRIEPSMSDKLEFGRSLGARQLAGRVRWLLFSHLGLARVQRYLPSGSRPPYGVFLHGIEAWRRLTPAELDALARAQVRIANSAFTARRVRDVNPEVGPIDVCPLALAAEPSEPRMRAVRGEGKTVLIVGRMSVGERYKGHEQLIEAWPEVLRHEPDARLVVVGEGDDRPRLEQVARASRATASIEFAGFLARGELENRYRNADVFVMPSRNEGFGLVYLEAMAHRLPCIGSIHDASGEVIRDGHTGLLVDSDRPDAIASAVVSLLGDPERRRRMGEAGYLRWQQHFTYECFRSRVVALVSHALEPAPAWSPTA